ncbi:MAG: hypothetical protein HOL62_04865 [Candidatus Marinimicrobia bacterium]|jgi:hypothetical protein|nr:hypothetical protein [Candidatus Neomarinimicrobiota bacterium]MBT4112224.1 hypothetical protein [Candidatus Neomarinimicrobiota bacterium]MBT5252012.1 hypothetical protein [Candidatus Neomarinimicrobiota bacterium]MBT7422862.1 hypothetical protein [Candidatus Neomarinimicrobiota bacterium]
MIQSNNISSIVKKIAGNPIIIGIILYIIIFIIPFSFLRTFDFGDWKYTPFVQSMITTFMGGGTIAIITAGLLVFQKKLDFEHKRNQEVFTNRITQYKEAVHLLSEAISDGKFDDAELKNIKELYYKLALIADTDVQKKFLEIIQSLNTSNLEDNDEMESVNTELIELIELMSTSLGFGMVEKSNVLKDDTLRELQESTILSSGNEIEEIQKDNKNPKNKFLDFISEIIKKNNLETDTPQISKTGGMAYYVKGKKFLQISFKGKQCDILNLRLHDYGYITPQSSEHLSFSDLREYSPKKSKSYIIPWGYSFFQIRFIFDDLSDEEKKYLEEIIKLGHETLTSDKKLSVRKGENKKLASIFVKGDNAKAIPWPLKKLD